jgi:hypothetical protein
MSKTEEISNIQRIIENKLQEVKRPGIEELIHFLRESDFFYLPASIKHHNARRGGLAYHSWNVYKELSTLCQKVTDLELSKDWIIICGLLHDICKIGEYRPIEITALTEEQQRRLSTEHRNFFMTNLEGKIRYNFREMYLKKQLLDGVSGLEYDMQSKNYSIPADALSVEQLRSKLMELTEGSDSTQKVNALRILPVVNALSTEINSPAAIHLRTGLFDYRQETYMPVGHAEKSLFLLSRYIQLTESEAFGIRCHMGVFDAFVKENDFQFKKYAERFPEWKLVFMADYYATTKEEFRLYSDKEYEEDAKVLALSKTN